MQDLTSSFRPAILHIIKMRGYYDCRTILEHRRWRGMMKQVRVINNPATKKDYLAHNRYVRTFGQANPKQMERVVAFVFASIRVQTFLLPKYMKEWRKHGLKSSWIWGNKRTGLHYVRKHRDDLYKRAMAIIKAK